MTNKEIIENAIVSRLPYRDGDGYSYGGEAIITIGERSVLVGSGKEAYALAQEIARRWNTPQEYDVHGT